MKIVEVHTVLVDVPCIRPHAFINHQIDAQSYLVLTIRTEDGLVGVGEGVSPGGPWWNGESVEGQKAVIDHHLGPALIGRDGARIRQIMAELERVAYGNWFAKAAIEMALYDLLGKALDAPLSVLLGGGAVRDQLPVRWALSSRGTQEVVDEVVQRHREGYRSFKFKLGAADPASDVRRIAGILDAVPPVGTLHADPNGAWDRRTAAWAVKELEALGVDVLEQPIDRGDLAGMADLVRRSSSIEIMGDESVCTPADALQACTARACDSVAVKPGKAGGIARALTVANVCAAAGVRCYGGTALESSIGTAAAAHLCASMPELQGGCELIGPLLLSDDLVEHRVQYDNGYLALPEGPGLGVSVDWDKVDKYGR